MYKNSEEKQREQFLILIKYVDSNQYWHILGSLNTPFSFKERTQQTTSNYLKLQRSQNDKEKTQFKAYYGYKSNL